MPGGFDSSTETDQMYWFLEYIGMAQVTRCLP